MLSAIGENPIVAMERLVRLRRIREKWHRGLVDYVVFPAIIFAPLAIGSGIMLVSNPGNNQWFTDMLKGLFPLTAFLLVLYTCYKATSLTYGSFTLEKEKKTYESLVGTLLTPAELLKGKLFAGLFPLLVEIAAFSPFMLVFLLGSDRSYRIELNQVAALIAALFIFAFFFGMVGIFSSLISPSSLRANQNATAILAAFFLLTPIIDAILGWALDWLTPTNGFAFATTVVNPLFLVTSLLTSTLYPAEETWFAWYYLFGLTAFAGLSWVTWKLLLRRACALPTE